MNSQAAIWRFPSAFAVGAVGAALVAFVWGFAYQFLYINSFPLMNPPTFDESIHGALVISLVGCVVGLVPAAIFALLMIDIPREDKKKTFATAAAAYVMPGFFLLVILVLGLMPLWIAAPVAASLVGVGAAGIGGAAILYAHVVVRRPKAVPG